MPQPQRSVRGRAASSLPPEHTQKLTPTWVTHRQLSLLWETHGAGGRGRAPESPVYSCSLTSWAKSLWRGRRVSKVPVPLLYTETLRLQTLKPWCDMKPSCRFFESLPYVRYVRGSKTRTRQEQSARSTGFDDLYPSMNTGQRWSRLCSNEDSFYSVFQMDCLGLYVFCCFFSIVLSMKTKTMS